MSTNSVNACEDPEMAECDGEKVVTMMDVLQEQEDFEEDVNAVLGASDDKNCTYSKGYIKRQAIYACMTCCAEAKDDPVKRAGVCLACSLSCHENHELIELYTKRNFRCDCGNPKFNKNSCQFTPNKTEMNEDNIYNQNFSGLYCICHRPYPDPEISTEQEMIQCIICEDWLHSSHLDAVVPPNDQYTEMICKGCMEQNEFLHDYSDLVVNKDNINVDIIDVSSKLNDTTKCNGISNTEMNTIDEQSNTENNASDLKQCETELQPENENMCEENSDKKVDSNKNDQSCPNSSAGDNVSSEKPKSIENKDSPLLDIPIDKENSSECKIDKLISDGELEINQNGENKSSTENTCSKIMSEEEHDNNEETEQSKSTTADCNTMICDTIDNNIQNNETPITIQDTTDKIVMETVHTVNKETEESKCSNDTISIKPVSEHEETINDQNEKFKTDNVSDLIVSEKQQINNEKLEEIKSLTKDSNSIGINISETEHKINQQMEEMKMLTESIKETDVDMDEKSSLMHNRNVASVESAVKTDYRSQEQVEEDLLLADPIDVGQGKEVDNDMNSNNTITKEIDESKSKSSDDANTSNSVTEIIENSVEKNCLNKCESLSLTEETKIIDQQMEDNTGDVMSGNETDNAENNDVQQNHIKENSNTIKDLSSKTTGSDILKRKHDSEADSDNSELKKPKLETPCSRPKGVKKIQQGATFWPSNFRHKLCTCNECIKMYQDLSLLFLIDPDDTVTAYERLGKERTDGKPITQYEKGMAALSSLGRVQQINALTEYTKMRDKLLEFLKSFKERKVIVKEEDIKAFFAGMKPVREPDGVYFCR